MAQNHQRYFISAFESNFITKFKRICVVDCRPKFISPANLLTLELIRILKSWICTKHCEQLLVTYDYLLQDDIEKAPSNIKGK